MASSMLSPEYNIYCLMKSGSLNEVAKIAETVDNFTVTLNKLHPAIVHMEDYFTDLYNQMVQYEREHLYDDNEMYQTQKYFFANHEFVQGTIFHRVLMRKGSYFYVLQQSDRGVRFLLYAVNRVHHSSISFGFAMRMPNIAEEKKNMKAKLKNITVAELEKMQIKNLPELIERDDLYFL
jgi:hypothetical protein